MNGEDRPTPEYLPAQRQSGPLRRRPPTDELEVDPDLARAIDLHFARKTKMLRVVAWLGLSVGGGGIGTGVKGAIDSARAEERVLIWIETFKRDLLFVRERMAPATTSGASPRHPPDQPAMKGTAP